MRVSNDDTLKTLAQWLTLAFVLAMAFTMLLDRGTGDVPLFIEKMDNAAHLGVRAAFASQPALEYPPLASVLLLFPHFLIESFGLSELGGFKLAIFLFYLLSTGILYALSRDVLLAAAFAGALIINSMHMGYLDIWCAPFLFVALWLMGKDRPAAGFFFYVLACLVKWQPIIIAPFVIIYAFQPRGLVRGLLLLRREDVWRSIAVISALVITCFLIFGGALTESLSAAARNSRLFLAPNGLNVPFLSAIIYRQFADPATLPSSVRNGFDISEHAWIFWTFRTLFAAAYVTAFLAALSVGDDRKRVLLLTVGAFCSYVMLSTGVHENHLAIGVFVAFFMVSKDKALWPAAIMTAAMFNFNLLLFYFSPALITVSDAPYAVGVIVTVLAFCWMVAFCIRALQQRPPARLATLYEGGEDALRRFRRSLQRPS